ncbi:P-loop containing nucleoside triphosphate hydrolase protein, partial [Spinellus fusiger]
MSWNQQQQSFGNNTFSKDFSNEGGASADVASRPPREPAPARVEGGENPNRSYNWASNRARYEYNENAVTEDGEPPRDATLENELFEQCTENQTTLDFSKYESIPIRVERGEAPTPIISFDTGDLHPVLKDNVRLLGYSKPTPVQTYSIPIVTSGKDLMACAQTGSGKTAAFLIPTLSSLFKHDKEWAQPRPAPYEQRQFMAEPLVLILAPTRELCSQIFDECRKFTYRSRLRPCAVYGGADTFSQLRQLERGCDILAAAPGRLMDFIERRKIGLSRVRYLILDEADRMLDMGFESIIRAVVEKKGCNPDRQTLMFSATFPRAIRKLARDFLKPDYLFLKVGRVGGTSTSITQNVIHVEEENKREALRELLNSQPPSRTLIFVETKRSADSLDQYLYERSFPSTSIHGDRTQIEREDALLAFKSGQCPILVATAVAARGIDIRNVMHVINFDMPNDMDEYIHRIGRTARVGKSGLATSFYNDRSAGLCYDLAKLLKECQQEIPPFLADYVTEDNYGGGDNNYGGDSNYGGGNNTFASSNANDSGFGAASAGWGQSEPAAPSGGGGWGQSEPAAPSGGGGWGQSEPAAPSGGGGWGQSEPAAPSGGGGWGQSEPAAPSGGGGW